MDSTTLAATLAREADVEWAVVDQRRFVQTAPISFSASGSSSFNGSAARLLQGALSARKTTKSELAELRQLLDEYEKGTR